MSIGTGFFFAHEFDDGKQTLPLIVTNKHVIKGCTKGRIRFHLCETVDGTPKPTDDMLVLDFDGFEQNWIPHPDDRIDLCASLLIPMIRQIKQGLNKEVYCRYLPSINIATNEELKELTPLRMSWMVGYPIGLWRCMSTTTP